MKFYKEGDKGKAICEHCGGVVNTTYMRRDVPFSDGHGQAKDILVSVCESCDSVVAIPAQSIPAIKESRKVELKSIETRMPAIYIDILDYSMQQVIKSATTHYRKMFISYYLHKFASNKIDILKAHKTASHDYQHISSSTRKRLSMKVNPHIAEDITFLQTKTNLNSTEIIKAAIAQLETDVIKNKDKEIISQLESIACIAG